jgi:hypothetical protein
MKESPKNFQEEFEANIKKVGSINRKISRGDAINELDFNEIYSTNSSLLFPSENLEALGSQFDEEQSQRRTESISEIPSECGGEIREANKLTFCDVINETRNRKKRERRTKGESDEKLLGPRQFETSQKEAARKKTQMKEKTWSSGVNGNQEKLKKKGDGNQGKGMLWSLADDSRRASTLCLEFVLSNLLILARSKSLFISLLWLLSLS